MRIKGIPRAMTDIKALANQLANEKNTDIMLFNATMERGAERRFIKQCAKRKSRDNVLCLVVTNGGDADAAYRAARCLQNRYEHVTVLVSGMCKSAGTLLALGAHDLVFSQHGELGPLDVQLMKVDDIWAMSSGLTVMNAFTALQNKAEEMFHDFALHIKAGSGGQVTFKTAADIATKLTGSLFGHIYQQVEVMHVGEAARAMNIANEYGERLNARAQNLRDGALARLVAAYPSHSFVIDIEEARTLFERVREATEEEETLCEALGSLSRTQATENTIIIYLNDELTDQSEHQSGQANEDSQKSGSDSASQEPRIEPAVGHPEPANAASASTGGGADVVPISSATKSG